MFGTNRKCCVVSTLHQDQLIHWIPANLVILHKSKDAILVWDTWPSSLHIYSLICGVHKGDASLNLSVSARNFLSSLDFHLNKKCQKSKEMINIFIRRKPWWMDRLLIFSRHFSVCHLSSGADWYKPAPSERDGCGSLVSGHTLCRVTLARGLHSKLTGAERRMWNHSPATRYQYTVRVN